MKFIQYSIVICRIADERYTFVVFPRRADERYAADIDVFDGVRVGDVGLGDGLFKRIEVDGDEVNVVPAEVDELLMVGFGGAGKDSFCEFVLARGWVVSH